MNTPFEVAGGSVTGRAHLKELGWKNNQDALAWQRVRKSLIAVVADGCSAAEQSLASHNEVGAQIGARMAIEVVTSELEEYAGEFFPWERVRQRLLYRIREIASMMGGNYRETIRDYFLFTLVGALITPAKTFLFSIGDGVIIVNQEIIQIGPFPNNQPPYLGYSLVPSNIDTKLCEFTVHRELPTKTIQSILLGTDGVLDLMKAETKLLPGKQKVVGSVAQFWTEDAFFANPDQVRRKLALVNHAATQLAVTGELIRFSGLLEDDTTLLAIRRKPHPIQHSTTEV